MRELLKQQQDEVAACRAALSKTEQAMAQMPQMGGGGEEGSPASGGMMWRIANRHLLIVNN